MRNRYKILQEKYSLMKEDEQDDDLLAGIDTALNTVKLQKKRGMGPVITKLKNLGFSIPDIIEQHIYGGKEGPEVPKGTEITHPQKDYVLVIYDRIPWNTRNTYGLDDSGFRLTQYKNGFKLIYKIYKDPSKPEKSTWSPEHYIHTPADLDRAMVTADEVHNAQQRKLNALMNIKFKE